ncbi:hypothetical protein PSTG_19501, partial [Puccinia striiformis f. sp. tritici PST-78]
RGRPLVGTRDVRAHLNSERPSKTDVPISAIVRVILQVRLEQTLGVKGSNVNCLRYPDSAPLVEVCQGRLPVVNIIRKLNRDVAFLRNVLGPPFVLVGLSVKTAPPHESQQFKKGEQRSFLAQDRRENIDNSIDADTAAC